MEIVVPLEVVVVGAEVLALIVVHIPPDEPSNIPS